MKGVNSTSCVLCLMNRTRTLFSNHSQFAVSSNPRNLQENVIKMPVVHQNICNVHHDKAVYVYQEGELYFSARFNKLTFQII